MLRIVVKYDKTRILSRTIETVGVQGQSCTALTQGLQALHPHAEMEFTDEYFQVKDPEVLLSLDAEAPR